MPLFRKKSDKQKTIPGSPDLSRAEFRHKRTPSNKSNLSTHYLSPNGDIGLPESPLGASGGARPTTLLLSQNETGSTSDQLNSPMRSASRLSKTFAEILHDKDALACFIQYMDFCKAGHLIRFWLDADSFQASTWSRLRSHSITAAKTLPSPVVDKALHEDKGNESKGQSSNSQEDSQSVCSSQTLTEDVNKPNSETETSVRCDSESRLTRGNVCDNEEGSSEEVQSKHQDACSDSKLRAVISSAECSRTDFSDEPGADNLDTNSASSDLHTEYGTASQDSKSNRGKSQENFAEKLKRSIERDAVQIFTKYLSQDTANPIGISDQLRNEAIRKICREDGEVDPQCFTASQEFVVAKMEKEHYPGFLLSEYHYKHQINILTRSKVHLADILYNEGALFYFMEYMEQEGGSNLLQFWMAADNFQQHLMSSDKGYDGMEAQTDAMVLYDKYFSLQASHPLGFEDAVRFEVEGNICREGGPLPDCFSKPKDIILRTIDKIYFPKYLTNDVYYNFLSELVSTVETSAYHQPTKIHKRTASDASSEHSSHSTGSESITSKNTYLAMDTSQMRRAVSKLDSDMDPALLNPDLLWKRSCPKMTLGKVDTFGQFMSEFDPSPDQEKSKGRKIFKKKGKEKEQEDMALQIAQMIINDVTSVTQAIGAMKEDGATDFHKGNS